MNITVEQIQDWLSEAEEAARIAAQEAYARNGNSDWDACGFGWVDIYKFCGKNLDGRTKMARMLKQAGVRQSYTRAFQVWNPGGYHGQSISIKEAAARAYANVLIREGFTAYPGSRLD
jgi:hypothetical protein